MKYFLLALLTCASLMVPLHGQAVSAAALARIANNQAARLEAANLLKAGDPQNALDKLRTAAMTGIGAPTTGGQVAIALCGIARSLLAEQHPAASSTALLAVGEAERARSTSPVAERAYLAAQIGELFEMVVGDRARAREHYQAALALDPRRKDAADGLWRITRLEALIEAKAQENAALRNYGK